MKTCIILHNMIVEDECKESLNDEYDSLESLPIIEVSHERLPNFHESLLLIITRFGLLSSTMHSVMILLSIYGCNMDKKIVDSYCWALVFY